MRRALIIVVAALLTCTAEAQNSNPCSCGNTLPGRPTPRTLKPYTGAPDDLRPYSKFTVPYYEHYTDLVAFSMR